MPYVAVAVAAAMAAVDMAAVDMAALDLAAADLAERKGWGELQRQGLLPEGLDLEVVAVFGEEMLGRGAGEGCVPVVAAY